MLTLLLSRLWPLACAWEAPLDPGAAPPLNTVEGTVVVSGVTAPGPVVMLLYAIDDPPPPAGTGRPVSFATVPAAAFDGGAGLLSAPFRLSEIPDGEWLITALMDMDGDFQPLLASNAGATCGDYAGAYLDSLDTDALGVVTVGGGERISGLTVLVASAYPTERPAFTLQTAAVDQAAAEPEPFDLAATGVHSEILELSDPGTACGVLLWTRLLDDDGDGQPDPHPSYGEPFFAAWPKIYLQYTGEGDAALAAGESYAAEAPLSPYLWEGRGGPLRAGVPAGLAALTAVFVPAAVHALPDGSEAVLTAPALPRGAWSVTVVAETGQTWTLPNELPAYPATEEDFDPASQGATLQVR